MLRNATLLIALCLSDCLGGDCPPRLPITLHRDQDFNVQVFFDNSPAAATPLQLYAGDKLVHSDRRPEWQGPVGRFARWQVPSCYSRQRYPRRSRSPAEEQH